MQRWLFQRELEKLASRPVFYLDECGVDHRLYRESGRAPRGQRIYQEVCGKRRERTSLIAASRKNKLIAPLVFQGSCNTEVVDVYLETRGPQIVCSGNQGCVRTRKRVFVKVLNT